MQILLGYAIHACLFICILAALFLFLIALAFAVSFSPALQHLLIDAARHVNAPARKRGAPPFFFSVFRLICSQPLNL
jgi:multisubunit Na+/H+ antiporter MnhG subunit